MTSEGRGELGVQGDVVESPDELGGRSGGHQHLSRRGGAGGLCSAPGDTRAANRLKSGAACFVAPLEFVKFEPSGGAGFMT